MRTAPIRSFRDLLVWQKAYALTRTCYRVTAPFPRREVYGLAAQIRRAAVSVPSNVAEGYGRFSRGDYLRFLRVAHGSLSELETQLLLSRDERFILSSAAQIALGELHDVGTLLRRLLWRLDPPTGFPARGGRSRPADPAP